MFCSNIRLSYSAFSVYFILVVHVNVAAIVIVVGGVVVTVVDIFVFVVANSVCLFSWLANVQWRITYKR
jgi:hypothetical protein